MGSCISKCKPKKDKQRKDDCKCQCIEKSNNIPSIQDKLVISQAPISPLSPSKSSSSAASSCTNSNYPATSTTSSSCSLLSSASSLASSSSSTTINSKSDRSFSNDYLWSCVKENPRAIRGSNLPIKIDLSNTRSSLPTRTHTSGKKPNGPKQLQPPSPQTVLKLAAQKRARCSSPSNLTRQKSFRMEREPDPEPNRPISTSGRFSRPISPSPSRRFTGDQISQGRAFTKSMRRDNFYVRPPSPIKANSNSRRYGRSNNLFVKKNEDGIKRVSSKIEELAIGGLVSSQDMDLMPIEDVHNPHIALDCFIFL